MPQAWSLLDCHLEIVLRPDTILVQVDALKLLVEADVVPMFRMKFVVAQRVRVCVVRESR